MDLDKDKENTKDYEVSFLIREENDLEAVSGLLGQHQAQIKFESPLKVVNLGYDIKGSPKAKFGFFHFSACAEEMEKLRSDLEAETRVLRFIIVTPPFAKEGGLSEPPVPKNEKQDSDKTVKDSSGTSSHLTNEALEKKIEEILK